MSTTDLPRVGLGYAVIEHSEDGAEPFGTYVRSVAQPPPQIGEIILLHWLDGREAYRARIFKIGDSELHVTAPDIFRELAVMSPAERVLMLDALSALYCTRCGAPRLGHAGGCQQAVR